MKIAVIVIRILMGLMFLNASLGYFLDLYPAPTDMPKDLVTYMNGISVVHLMDVVKAIELICAVSFLIGRYVALSSVVLVPITFNILLLHVVADPKTAALAIVIFALNLFLLFAYKKHYSGLFVARRIE